MELYLRFGEISVHAPLHKVLLRRFQILLVRFFAVNSDQLLGKLLRQQLGHLQEYELRQIFVNISITASLELSKATIGQDLLLTNILK